MLYTYIYFNLYSIIFIIYYLEKIKEVFWHFTNLHLYKSLTLSFRKVSNTVIEFQTLNQKYFRRDIHLPKNFNDIEFFSPPNHKFPYPIPEV